MKYLKEIVRFLARWLLTLMGWELLDHDRIVNHKDCNLIVLFSHTSKWDFVLMLLYGLAHRHLLEDVYIVMKPQLFSTWIGNKFFRWLGGIPATRAEDSNNGFVESICEYLTSKKKYQLLIAPQGKMAWSKWKSGYYWIAAKLDIPIIVLGFDYKTKTLVAFEDKPSKPMSIIEGDSLNESDRKRNYVEIDTYLKRLMAKITPLYVEQSYVHSLYPSRSTSSKGSSEQSTNETSRTRSSSVDRAPKKETSTKWCPSYTSGFTY